MLTRPAPPLPAIGTPVAEIETPALILDLDICEANIATMADFARAAGIRLRPHAKSHRCPALALRQVAAGAVGVCVQTVGEAEAMIGEGVPDVLITNQIVSEGKLRRIAALSERARIALCVDDSEHLARAERVARAEGVSLECYVEIDVGGGRCGVLPGEAAAGLAARIAGSEALRFGGLQAYHGKAQHFEDPEERRDTIARAVAFVTETLDALDRRGIACPIVTGAGTGTHPFEAASGVYGELQAGSYLFMDTDYARIRGEDGKPLSAVFAHSLFILSSVISRAKPGQAVADAGLKSYSREMGLPGIAGDAGAVLTGCSDEHSVLGFADDGVACRIGDKLRLIPSHCDPTVNLHDAIIGYREGCIAEILPVAARGASA